MNESIDLSTMKFLVVDDSALVRGHIENLLRGLGAKRVDKAENGKEALIKIKKAFSEKIPYDLITLDVEMPEMSGMELLKSIRADTQLKSSVVMMVTSVDDESSIKLLISARPDSYVLKPFTDETFRQKLAALYPRLKK